MAAIMNLDPSLIQYFGGVGKGLSAIGGAMSSTGQAKLALEQQDRENKSKQAYFDLNKGMYDQGQKDKFEAKNDKLASNATTNAFLLGQDAPQEMSNEYARLSMIDPAITAAAMKSNAKEYKGSYDGVDGNKYAIWGDGTSTVVNGGAKPFIDKAFTIDTQYVGGKPTKIGSSLLGGKQTSVTLPGVTENEYNTRLSSGLSLSNTLATQANSAKLGLEYQPLVADAKNAKEIENTISTLAASGFTEELTPGQVQLYANKKPKGYELNVQEVEINGVKKYLTKPNALYVRPKTNQ